MNTELQQLQERKDYLERELRDVDRKINDAEIEEITNIKKQRYEHVLNAIKAAKPFILRLNPGCGSFYNVIVIKQLEAVKNQLNKLECTISGAHLEFTESMLSWSSEHVSDYKFTSDRFDELDVMSGAEFKKIFGEQKNKLECQLAALNVHLANVADID